MKRVYQYTKALLVALILGANVQGFANIKITYDKSHPVSDNYYVPAGGVYVAPSGIFIRMEEELVQVGVLCSDEKGVFVPGTEMSRQFVWCPICQHWYDPAKPHICKSFK